MVYKILDLPPIPEELLKFEDRRLVSDIDTGYGLDHYKEGRKLTPCQYIYAQLLHPPLKAWIQATFGMRQPARTAIQWQKLPPGASETTHIVHSDILRNWCINYILDTGGGARTTWYKERNRPLHRYRRAGQHQQSDTGFVNYSDLEVLDSVCCQPKTWYLIPLTVLHDVDHITRDRIGITISLDEMSDIKPELRIPL